MSYHSFFFTAVLFLLEKRTSPLSKISEINSDILACTDSKTVETLLFDDTLFNRFGKNLMTLFSILTKVRENGLQKINLLIGNLHELDGKTCTC